MDKKEKAQFIKKSFHSIYEKHFSNLTSDLKEKLYYELEQMYSNHSEEEREKVFSFIECKLNLDKRKQLLSEFYLNHAESTPS
jgi:lysine/ornithine N-monooxygenase